MSIPDDPAESIPVKKTYCDRSQPHVWFLIYWEGQQVTPFSTLEDAKQYVRAGIEDESILYPALLEIHAENIMVIE